MSQFSDRAEVDFTLARATSTTGKSLIVTRSSTPFIPVGAAGYGSAEGDRNSFYDAREARRDPDYLLAEYMQGFYGEVFSFELRWWSKESGVEITIQADDRSDPANPNSGDRLSFTLKCQLAG